MSDPNRPFVETGDETDEEKAQLKQRRVTQKTAAEVTQEAVAFTMRSIEGRRTVWWILLGLGLNRTTGGPGLDTNITMANVGRHAYAIELLGILKASHPAEVRLMQQENDL